MRTTPVDLTLIHRSQAGDEDAFAEIFETCKNLVFRTAFLVLDNAQDAEDVLQEVFIQVHHSLASYTPARGAFTTWIHRITVNRCLNRRRHWSFFNVRLDEISETNPAAISVPDESGTDIDGVRKAISVLSLKLRAVVILRYYWELSYAEISEVMELPLGTVKSRLNLALRTLQVALEDELDPTAGLIKEEPQ
jgi:RNA polymerase sigma-70 factor (ECF subfamily)